MSEWITDRLPTVEDSLHYAVIVWDEKIGPMVWSYDGVNEGQPWQHIPKPEPYDVKPKRWTVMRKDDGWMLYDWDFPLVRLQGLPSDTDAAQRICDIYNEVMP